jgi:nucleoside-diphosphate kinase
MAVERTLVLVKPDGVARRLIGEVIARIERKGLDITAMELCTMDLGTARQHYAEHEGKPFFDELVSFITSGPLVAMKVEGEQAVTAVRTLIGPTDPVKAQPGTIRGDFALDIGQNLVHGSDSPESGERELKLFF